MTAAVIIAVAIGLFGALSLGAYLGLYFLARRPRARTSQGMRLYVDRGLVIDVAEVSEYVEAFIAHMTPAPFADEKKLRAHIADIDCGLRAQKLTTAARGEKGALYNGLTLSAREIEVACDADFQVAGRVAIRKTAFAYELLNACIEEFAGHEVAMAEGFIDAQSRTHWAWFADADGDGDVDAADVEKWKAARRPYDEALRRLRG